MTSINLSQQTQFNKGSLGYGLLVYLARSRKGFSFSQELGEYVHNSNGRVVTPGKINQESSAYVENVRDNMTFQAKRLTDGRISLPEFQRQMRKEIKDAWRTQYLLGRGGRDQMTQADWGRIGGRLQFQYARLNQFAADIAADTMTEAQIQARAALYSGANRTALYDGTTQRMQGAGKEEERRVLNPAEHCPDCTGFAARGWVPIGTLPEPGQQSVCLTNCKCTKEYR